MKKMANPLWDTSGDILFLDAYVVAEVAIVDSVSKIKKLGEDQCKEFFKKHLVDRTNSVNETILKNKLRLFSRHSVHMHNNSCCPRNMTETSFQHCTSPAKYATLFSMIFFPT